MQKKFCEEQFANIISAFMSYKIMWSSIPANNNVLRLNYFYDMYGFS